jgi:hypothetical protein
MTAFRRAMSMFVSATLLLAMTARPVGAQDNTGASGVRISPTRSELTIEKGQSAKAEFSIKNVTGAQIRVVTELNDFDPQDNGSPKPLKDGERNAASLKDMLILPQDRVLEPNEEFVSEVFVNVPSSAAAGAYYGLVLYKAVPLGSQAPGQVSLTGSVAGIILVNVPGEVTEGMQLVSIKAGKRTNDSDEIRLSNIFAQPFDSVQILLKNTGNSILKPYGRVEVKDFRGRQIATYELNITDPKANVLPNSRRIFTDKIEGVKLPGKYTIEAALSYSNGGDVLVQKVTVWYLPIWVVVIAVAILAGAVFFVMRMLRKRSRK